MNGIALALGPIIFAKLLTQAGGLDPHEGIDRGSELLGTLEDLQSDVVGLQPLAAPSQTFIDGVLKIVAGVVTGGRAAVKDAVQLLTNSFSGRIRSSN